MYFNFVIEILKNTYNILGLPAKGSIKNGLVIGNIGNLEPLNLLYGLAFRCYPLFIKYLTVYYLGVIILLNETYKSNSP